MNQLTLTGIEDGFLDMSSVLPGAGDSEIELDVMPENKQFSIRTDQFHLPALEGGAGRGARVETMVQQILEYIRTVFDGNGLLGQAELLVLEDRGEMPEKEARIKAHREYGRLMRESWGIEGDDDPAFRPVAIIVRKAQHKRIAYEAFGVFGPQASSAQSAVKPIDEAALAREVGQRSEPYGSHVMPTLLRDLLELGFRAYLYENVVNRRLSRPVNVFADDLLFDMKARTWKSFVFWTGWGFVLTVSAHGKVRATIAARKYQFPKDSAGYQALVGKGAVTLGGMTVGRRYRRDARDMKWNHIDGLVAADWGAKKGHDPATRDKQIEKVESSRLLAAGFVNQHFEAFLRRAGITAAPVMFEPSRTLTVQNAKRAGGRLDDESAIGDRLTVVLPERDPAVEAALGDELAEAGFTGVIAWETSLTDVPADVPALHVSRSLAHEEDLLEGGDQSIWVTLKNTKTGEVATKYPATLDETVEWRQKRDWMLLACDPYTEVRLAMHEGDLRDWRPVQNINTAHLRTFNDKATVDPLKRSLMELALKSFVARPDARWSLSADVDETVQGQYLALYLRTPAKASGRVSAIRFEFRADGLHLQERLARPVMLPRRGGSDARMRAMMEAVGDAAADLWLPELEDVLRAPGRQGIPVHDNLFLLIDLDRGRVLRSVHGHPVHNPALLYRDGTPNNNPEDLLTAGWWSRAFDQTAVPHLVMPTALPVAVEPQEQFARVAFRLSGAKANIPRNTQVRDYLVHDLSSGDLLHAPHRFRVFGANLALLTVDTIKSKQTSRISLIEKLARLLAIN